MTTPTPHGAPELPVVAYGYENTRPTEKSALMTVALSNADDQYPELAVPLVKLSDARAAIQQAAGAVPEGWKLVPVDLTEDMIAAWFRAPMPNFGDRGGSRRDMWSQSYRAMLAASPSPLGREAGSSDNFVPCAGGGVKVPLSDAMVEKLRLWACDDMITPKRVYFRAFRDAEKWHGINTHAPTSQINHGSAPREDGHG